MSEQILAIVLAVIAGVPAVLTVILAARMQEKNADSRAAAIKGKSDIVADKVDEVHTLANANLTKAVDLAQETKTQLIAANAQIKVLTTVIEKLSVKVETNGHK